MSLASRTRTLLGAAAICLAALPALANAPEKAPKPQWRAEGSAALLAAAPLAAAQPALPKDPDSLSLAPAPLPPALAAGGPIRVAAASAAPAIAPATPEVASAAIRPLSGPLVDGAALALERSPRPKWRPDASKPPAGEAAAVEAAFSPLVLAMSPRPKFRPKDLAKKYAAQRRDEAKVEQASLRIAPPDPSPKEAPKSSGTGGLCGIAGLTGSKLAPVAAGGCSIKDPVRVTAVNGVALSAPAVMDCATAKSLSTWVDRSLIPVVGKTGGGVKRIEVAASYACRPRNNQKGQKLSEHGRGKAIDITGIQLKNGSTLSVLHGWKDPKIGPMLKAMHRGACGPFGTVLGPNANAFHRDHFHFDTASYRSGAYCK